MTQDEAEDEDEGEQSQEVELPSAVRLLVLIKRLGKLRGAERGGEGGDDRLGMDGL